MTIDHDDTSYEPPHATSPTDHVLNELQLHGYRPFQDEPDPRPLPEARTVAGAVADIFDALVATLSDTRLEPDLEDLLWSTVNLFHRANERIERELDDNEQAQRRSQREQDGSEIRSVELERLTAEGMTLDRTAQHHGILPRPGGRALRPPHRIALASAQRIDGQPSCPDRGDDRQPRLSRRQASSRDRGAAARRAKDRLHRRPRLQRSPPDLGQARSGPRQAPGHGAAARRIAEGRRAHRRPLGRSPQGAADRLQARLDHHAKAAPFKRNDPMLEVLPIGVLVAPGTGIQENLADKARRLGIPVWKFGSGGA